MLRVLLLGATGRLGAALRRRWSARHQVTPLPRAALDLARPVEEVRAALAALPRFDVLVNAAAEADVDRCEREPLLAESINHHAVAALADTCADRGARLVHFSTDYVFDGAGRAPLTEESPTAPLSAYGRAKLAGERAALGRGADALVVRVCWLFGPDKPSFPETILRRAQAEDHVAAVSDKWSTPTFTEDLAEWLEPLLSPGGPGGLLHACNAGSATWRDYAQRVLDLARVAGLPLRAAPEVRPLRLAEMRAFLAPRPPYTVLNLRHLATLLGRPPRSWEDALAEHLGRLVR